MLLLLSVDILGPLGFAYEGYVSQNRVIIARLIPLENIVEVNINNPNNTLVGMSKRKRFTYKAQLEALK
ncbi:MAG: hypothetical protein WBE34_11305 [Candidatus Nitrosopolaris sp.]